MKPKNSNNDRIILVLLGKRGAGKTSIANLFVKEKKFFHIEMSSYIKSIKLKTAYNSLKLKKFVEITHQLKGKNYFIKQIIKELIVNNCKHTVITGIRHLAELNFLNNNLTNSKLVIVYLNVSLINRLLRIFKRENRNSLLQFFIEEYYSEKWGNKSLKRNSIKLNFNGTIEENFTKLNNTINRN